jgi:hypothetical protein
MDTVGVFVRVSLRCRRVLFPRDCGAGLLETLGFEEGQGAGPPAAGRLIEFQEQVAPLALRQLSVDQNIQEFSIDHGQGFVRVVHS